MKCRFDALCAESHRANRIYIFNTILISSILLQRQRALQNRNVEKHLFALYATRDRAGGEWLKLKGVGLHPILQDRLGVSDSKRLPLLRVCLSVVDNRAIWQRQFSQSFYWIGPFV